MQPWEQHASNAAFFSDFFCRSNRTQNIVLNILCKEEFCQRDDVKSSTKLYVVACWRQSMPCLQGKPDSPVASQINGGINGGSVPQINDKLSNGHQQALVTPQIVKSVEGTSNAHQTRDGTSNQEEGLPEDENQPGSRQNLSHQASAACLEPQQQQAASQRDSGQPRDWDFASRREAANPQSQEDASPGNAGHLQQSGASPERLSSRRRSMERPSASLTLPFEQLNFVFHHINYSVPATVRRTSHLCKHYWLTCILWNCWCLNTAACTSGTVAWTVRRNASSLLSTVYACSQHTMTEYLPKSICPSPKLAALQWVPDLSSCNLECLWLQTPRRQIECIYIILHFVYSMLCFRHNSLHVVHITYFILLSQCKAMFAIVTRSLCHILCHMSHILISQVLGFILYIGFRV